MSMGCAKSRLSACFWSGALLAALSLASAPAAFAESASDSAPPAEYRSMPFPPALPLCNDPISLNEVAANFAIRETQYWNSTLAMTGFSDIVETGYRTNGPSYIPRRYCRAEAMFNDGQRRRLVYNIGSETGFASIGTGVTWCVVGLDRNHAYGPNCRAAGP